MGFRILEAAEQEAIKASRWYETEKAGLGDEYLDDHIAGLASIRDAAKSHPYWELLRTRREIRYRLSKRFSYCTIFEIREEEIVVIAVCHTSQKPNYWKDRLND